MISQRLLPSVLYGADSDRRYSRQERFAGLGREGQERIARSRIAVAGCGALGSAQLELLARAGVGYLRPIDRDYVELSNLQRQFLFDEADAAEGLPKAVAAARRLVSVNSRVVTEPVVADLTASNADDLLGGVDLILDGSDNFETRYLVNDLRCAKARRGFTARRSGATASRWRFYPAGQRAFDVCIRNRRRECNRRARRRGCWGR